jgi:hypothetical protein
MIASAEVCWILSWILSPEFGDNRACGKLGAK